MSDFTVNQVLNQMRVLAQGNGLPQQQETRTTDFASVLKSSVDQVNAYQQEAAELKTAYTMGDKNVDIPEVMVAVQKASLSFEAAAEVRNQLLNAYQEVMNMQV